MNSIRRYLFVTFLISTVLFIFGAAQAQTSLDFILKPYLTKYDLPAIAAAVVKDGKIISAGAIGTRRAGVKIPVTINDWFHLGSDTKAMTALLAAMLVEEGKLRWNTTPAEVFPELADKMDRDSGALHLNNFIAHKRRSIRQ